MEEVWKEIPGFDNYQVSNLGRVKSKKRILKLYENKRSGYLYTHLSQNKKTKVMRVHRIVATVFIENKNNKLYINHIDGNKTNNCVSNLEWCTPKENSIHARDVLKIDFSKGIEITHLKSQKRIIRSDGKIYNSIKEAKEDMKNKNAHIVEVCRGKLKTACGFGWKYLKEGV